MVNLVKEFKEINKRAKVVERLYTLYEIRQSINKKINKAEQELSKLDMEVDKNDIDQTTKT